MTEDVFESKAHELLIDLANKVERALKDLCIVDPIISKSIGQEIAVAMAHDWGGLNIYFPKGLNLETHKLARRVWNEFTGNNVSDLAQKYKISQQWVYKIIRDMRAMESARRQPRLFEDLEIEGEDEDEDEKEAVNQIV